MLYGYISAHVAQRISSRVVPQQTDSHGARTSAHTGARGGQPASGDQQICAQHPGTSKHASCGGAASIMASGVSWICAPSFGSGGGLHLQPRNKQRMTISLLIVLLLLFGSRLHALRPEEVDAISDGHLQEIPHRDGRALPKARRQRHLKFVLHPDDGLLHTTPASWKVGNYNFSGKPSSACFSRVGRGSIGLKRKSG